MMATRRFFARLAAPSFGTSGSESPTAGWQGAMVVSVCSVSKIVSVSGQLRNDGPGGYLGVAPARVALRGMSTKAFVDWSFNHYLRIAHPAYARELALRSDSPRTSLRAAA